MKTTLLKSILVVITLTYTLSTFWAQAPQKMSYQAVIRNSSNQLVTNTKVSVKVSILQDSATGTAVYTETLSPTTNANGLISIEIGGGAGFDAINWASGVYFIKCETDPAGGTSYSITGTSQLLSVPYALYAKSSGTAGDKGPVGDKGPQGDKGATGDKGEAGDPAVLFDDTQALTNKTWTSSKINAELATKVVKVTGKGLSAEDYTTTEKTKVSAGFIHYVGELYGGGIIVSVWKVNGVEHGLITALTDQSASLIWTTAAYQSITVPGGATSQIDGLANSNAIIAQAGAGTSYAAGLCRSYNATGDGGLNDWYLPAAWELNQCYSAAFVVNKILGATNGFQFASYWSSTESNTGNVWYQYFDYGNMSGNPKSLKYRVRAVRRY